MSELTVATRYAKSIIDLAQEQNVFEDVKNDMDLFFRTLRTNAELQTVFSNPIISQYKKIKILEALFAAKMNKMTISFFNIMINKGRGELLFGTSQEYVNQYNIIKHITKASIVSATALSAVNKQTMIDELQKTIGGQIILNTQTDPSLIGGFVLTVGDQQLDTSISSSLKNLKKDFAQRVQ